MQLPVWTTVHVSLVFVVAITVGALATPLVAYLTTLAIYWLLCWLLVVLYNPRIPAVNIASNKHPLFDWLPFVPFLGVLGVAFWKGHSIPPLPVAFTVVCLASFNGFTEEMFWRRLYADSFPSRVMLGFTFPLVLFTAWHVALLVIPGVEYDGGALGLIGGAALLGLIWGICYWRNRRFWIVGTAHALVNIVAFMMLANDNDWLGQ